jgi:hypothetical protein
MQQEFPLGLVDEIHVHVMPSLVVALSAGVSLGSRARCAGEPPRRRRMYPDVHGGTAVGGVCWTAEHALHDSFGQRWLPMRTQHSWLMAGGLTLALAAAVPPMTMAPARRLFPAAKRRSR